MGRFVIACLLLCWVTSNVEADATNRNWVLVTTPALRDSVEPLVDLRRDQGYQVTIVDDWQSNAVDDVELAEQLRSRIEACSEATAQNYVLIVGSYRATDSESFVPTARGVHGRMQARATDYYYSLPEADGSPTIAVGRLPARDAEEATAMVRKIIRSETETPDPAAPHLGIIVCHPGGETQLERQFGEAFLQMTVADRLKRFGPQMRIQVAADIENSTFANPDQDFQQSAFEVLTSGSVFTIYCGHSSASGLWSKSRYVVSRDQFESLKTAGYPGVLLSCGCFTCQIDERQGLRSQPEFADGQSAVVTSIDQGFGIAAIRNPHGPAAVIGPYNESYAAFGKLALDALERQVAEDDSPTRIGGYFTAVQRGIIQGQMDALMFFMFDQADGSRGKTSLAQQRSEHVEMWTLLGDPAMNLPPLPHPTSTTSVER